MKQPLGPPPSIPPPPPPPAAYNPFPEPPPPPPVPAGLAESLCRRARAFEPVTLLRLLQRAWPDRRIWLQSKPSHAPEPTPVESLTISPDRIVLTLNFGFRSSTSPLPSYFGEVVLDPKVGPAFERLLQALDLGLLPARLEATDAAESRWLFPGERPLRGSLRALAGLSSSSGLWWLFSRVYPELRVSVKRGVLGVTLAADEARVGFALLGTAMLGGSAAAPIAGFDVVLQATPTDTWPEGDWPSVVTSRLGELVWPALRGSECLLRVWLVAPEGAAAMRLGEGRMGVEALAVASRPGVSLLFEGRVPEGPETEAG